MALLCPSKRLLRSGFQLCAALLGCGSGLASAAAGPGVRCDRLRYLVGAPVQLRGTGFASSTTYAVSSDGVCFGQDQTDSAGGFATSLIFPFSPSSGVWTVQLDTRKAYVGRPAGPLARDRVRIG